VVRDQVVNQQKLQIPYLSILISKVFSLKLLDNWGLWWIDLELLRKSQAGNSISKLFSKLFELRLIQSKGESEDRALSFPGLIRDLTTIGFNNCLANN
jgi:hypothetical protein